ncbi:MAG: hypothetical protein JO271_15335 [Verrucomicrobia bacterium]|nr:hypothetical protein [Verrucomicrobiota bacterium]MBV9276111.1 hypothetical protein [Verrucomicrobiota bacterium]
MKYLANKPPENGTLKTRLQFLAATDSTINMEALLFLSGLTIFLLLIAVLG